MPVKIAIIDDKQIVGRAIKDKSRHCWCSVYNLLQRSITNNSLS